VKLITNRGCWFKVAIIQHNGHKQNEFADMSCEEKCDETLPNLIFFKRKHPRKGEKKKPVGQEGPKDQASKQLKRGRPQGGKGRNH